MRRLAAVVVAAGRAVLGGVPAAAGPAFTEQIDLPHGFAPEGIAIGQGHTFFVGSIPTGAVYRGDLRTGEGSVLVPAAAGRQAIGLDVDSKQRLFVAGGPTGRAFVYDARQTRGQIVKERAANFLKSLLRTEPAPVLSSIVDAVTTPDAELLDELHRLVQQRRRETGRR